MLDRILVLAVICVFSMRVAGAAELAQDTTLSKKVESFCQAKSPFDQAQAGIELFQQATIAELEELKMDRHEGVAIRAAWEFVRRTVDEEEKDEKAAPARVNAESLHRFLGFVEGRLKISLPVSWGETVLEACASRRTNMYFIRREEHYPNRVKDVVLKNVVLRVPKDTSIKKVGEDLLIAVQGQSCRLPSRVLKYAKGPVDAISALIRGKRCYLALYAEHCSAYDLLCIQRESSQVLWKARVWGHGGLSNGRYLVGGTVFSAWGNSVAIVQQDDRLLVFGIGFSTAYIECFSTADGSNIFRCSTSY